MSPICPSGEFRVKVSSGGFSGKGQQRLVVGLLTLDYVKLAAASNDQQYLITMFPADYASADKLRHLERATSPCPAETR